MPLIDFPTLNAAKKFTTESLLGAGALLGIGLSKVEIDSNGHLIVTYDKPLPDGSITRDAGPLPTGAKFVKDVQTPSKVWTIQHNLGKPWYELDITTIDVLGNRVIGDVDVENSTENLLIIKFDVAIAGIAVVKQ